MEVLRHPSPILKGQAEPVDFATDTSLRDLVRSMAQTMYNEDGVGLAAPQVGVSKRVIVFDVNDRLSALCNPVITEFSEETAVANEGCLSLPGINVPVERSVRIVCSGQTVDGDEITIEARDFLARVLQHETDHLDGVIILDRAPADMRKSLIRAYNEANRL